MSLPVIAAAGPSAYWYLTRGTGAVALILLTLSVILGVLGSLRFAVAPRWPRFAIDAVHRDLSLLAVAFLLLHILTSVLDSFAPIQLTDAVIPFASSYRPLWLGLGAVSFDLMIALVITSIVRRRVGYRAWRAIHWLAYAGWPAAVLHGLGTGSDTKLWWMLALTFGCVAAVLVAVCVRIARSGPEATGLRAPAFLLTIAGTVGLAVFTLAGPLQRGWARRAGTPAHLLASTSAAVVPVMTAGNTATGSGTARRSAKASALVRTFSARLTGTITQTPAAGGALVDLALRVSGGVRGRLRVRMAGSPLPSGGLSMTGSQVDLIESGYPSALQGRIVALQGQQFVARVADRSGAKVRLDANLSVDSQSGRVSGSLSGAPA
jgi:methionine sulfoxide reductase heme-binding subunit